jgi:hypothetical protein
MTRDHLEVLEAGGTSPLEEVGVFPLWWCSGRGVLVGEDESPIDGHGEVLLFEGHIDLPVDRVQVGNGGCGEGCIVVLQGQRRSTEC